MMDLTFLIQKAGDREWLPLESPTVEVLEGRYHLMAHTTQLDQFVELQIRHRYEENGVLQEERQQRRQQPDTHGNLSLLPDSYLGHGLWTLTCTFCSAQADPQSQSINLQVLAEDCESISDWEFVEASQGSWPQVREMDASEMSAIATQINAEKSFVTSGQTSIDRVKSADFEQIGTAASLQVEAEENTAPFVSESQEDTLVDLDQSYVVELDEISDGQNSDAVSLPVLPQQEHSIQFQQSQGSPLPPQLSARRTAEQNAQPLDLPTFPRDVHWRYIPLNKISVGMYQREAIQKTHHSDIEQAFMALELQQRFWRTMQQLVDPATVQAGAEPVVSVFTRTAG